MNDKVTAPCHYCGGTGWNDESIRVDVDDYRGAECEECEGSGIASRRAGGRDTGLPKRRQWVGGDVFLGDSLEVLAKVRMNLLKMRRSGDWKRYSFEMLYGEALQTAISPVYLPDLRPTNTGAFR